MRERNPIDDDLLRRLVAEGLSLKLMRQHFRTSLEMVSRRIRELGLVKPRDLARVERNDRIRAMAADQLTCEAAAALLGLRPRKLRNIALALGVHFQNATPSRSRPRSRKIRIVSVASHPTVASPTSQDAAELLTPPASVAGGVSLLELQPDACKWPIGRDGRGHVFCGEAAQDGRSYCPEHCAHAYVPVQPRVARPPVARPAKLRRAA